MAVPSFAASLQTAITNGTAGGDVSTAGLQFLNEQQGPVCTAGEPLQQGPVCTAGEPLQQGPVSTPGEPFQQGPVCTAGEPFQQGPVCAPGVILFFMLFFMLFFLKFRYSDHNFAVSCYSSRQSDSKQVHPRSGRRHEKPCTNTLRTDQVLHYTSRAAARRHAADPTLTKNG